MQKQIQISEIPNTRQIQTCKFDIFLQEEIVNFLNLTSEYWYHLEKSQQQLSSSIRTLMVRRHSEVSCPLPVAYLGTVVLCHQT